MNRKYELLLLINPNMGDAEKAKLIETVESNITGNIVKKEDWGVKEFAYTIKKSNTGHYVLYYVETPTADILKIKELVAVEADVFRTMILKHEKDFPFNLKTSKDLVFPERKPRTKRPVRRS